MWPVRSRGATVVVIVVSAVCSLAIVSNLLSLGQGAISVKHENAYLTLPRVGVAESSLATWLREKGAVISNVEADVTDAGRRLVATAEISPGDLVMSIPVSLAVTKEAYNSSMPESFKSWHPISSSQRFQMRKQSGGTLPPDHMTPKEWEKLALVVFIATHAREIHESDPFAKYFKTLPPPDRKSLAWRNMPRFWDEEQLRCLKGSKAGERVRWDQERVQRLYKMSGLEDQVPFETFVWAVTIAGSRTFNIGDIHHDRHYVLVPFADLLNDDSVQPHLLWSMNFDTGTVDFTARRGAMVGEEVTTSYGLQPNLKLLMSYGFTYPEVPGVNEALLKANEVDLKLSLDDAVTFVGGAQGLAHIDEKRKLLASKSLNGAEFPLTQAVDGDMFWKLLQFARFLTLPAMDETSMMTADCRDQLPSIGCHVPLDDTHEQKALMLLNRFGRSRLALYPTTPQDDEHALDELTVNEASGEEIGHVPWRVSCLRVLRDEKRPLIFLQKLVERVQLSILQRKNARKDAQLLGSLRLQKAPGATTTTTTSKPGGCVGAHGGPPAGDPYWRCVIDRLVDAYQKMDAARP